jgi:beta-RFAP synthase
MTTGPQNIEVTAHARLHLGFLDLEGGLGRRFGCLGLAITAPVTRLRLARAPTLSVEGPEAERARRHLLALAEEFGHPPLYRLMVDEAIPAHAGLGSGTQLALAIGTAYGLIEGRALSPAEVGAILNRGARSGIGAGAFATGGLILDGGKAPGGGVPPVVASFAVPQSWRVILLLDPASKGVHGSEERKAFRELPPFPRELAGQLCRVTLMQALPAAVEGELRPFGEAVDAIQEAMGSHFASAQGGSPFTSARVGAALNWLKAQGLKGTGQSSWGPTGFAFVNDATLGSDLIERLKRTGLADGLDIRLTEARNKGAGIATAGAQQDGQAGAVRDEETRGGNGHG